MSEQPRDEQGRFTGESGNETLNRWLREASARGRVRIVAELPDGNHAMNEALLRATGRLPPLGGSSTASGRADHFETTSSRFGDGELRAL